MAKAQKISKWGNSLALRIPREAADRAGLSEGDDVAIRASVGRLTVLRKARKYRIEDFVKEMTRATEPELVDWGPSVGKEIW